MLHRRKSRSKKPNSRNGIATVELALCLPLLALICFGSIQASSSVLLRHKAVTILEMGTLDFMLGKVPESELVEHIESLSNEFELVGASVTATPETIDETNYLRVHLTLPMADNTLAPMYVGSPNELETQMLIYRP